MQPTVVREWFGLRAGVEPELRIALPIAHGVRRLAHPREAERLEQRIVESRRRFQVTNRNRDVIDHGKAPSTSSLVPRNGGEGEYSRRRAGFHQLVDDG